MTRGWALLLAAGTMLAMTGHAQAQGFFGESSDNMGGGPSFFGGGGAGPIRRTR